MEHEPFVYTPPATNHHSLNWHETVPRILKALKAHCTKHKQHPVSIDAAGYDFVNENGKTKTIYSVSITTAPGKGDVPFAAWVKSNKFPWTFGFPSEVAREC